MIRIAVAGLALATLSVAAQARPDHDASIDAAAARIVAEKIGTLRGGFAFGIEPKMTTPVDRQTTGAVASRRAVTGQWTSGLAPAVEVRFAVPLAR